MIKLTRVKLTVVSKLNTTATRTALWRHAGIELEENKSKSKSESKSKSNGKTEAWRV